MKHHVLTFLTATTAFSAIASNDVPITSNSPLVDTESPIMFTYHDEEATLAKLDLATMKFTQLTVPEGAFGFDYGKLAGNDTVTALVMTKEGIYSLDERGKEELIAVTPLLSKLEFKRFKKITFVNDINKDGLSDIILPDLNQTNIYIQNADKTFTLHKIDLTANMTGKFSDDKLNIDINLTVSPTVFDVNQDGFNDLVFEQKHLVNVLYANKDGFAEQLVPLTLPVETGKFEQEKTQRVISKLQDINNDGKLDLVTRYSPITKGMDALDAKATYQLFYGIDKGQFSTTPTNLPEVEGTGMFEFEHDFNGDGKKDMQMSFIDFGLGTITSMAFGGGEAEVDVELSFYAQQPDGSFSKKPDAEKEVEMNINMNGNEPAMTYYTGDINGDGRQDAIFKTGSKTLKVYLGHENTVLDRKSKKIKLKLPDSAADVKLVDINTDGKQDFVFRYKGKNGKSTIKTRLN